MDHVVSGRLALEDESNALIEAAKRIGETFNHAVDSILRAEGKLVTTGMGKSGHIARKLASTLSSTGTSSFFLHPSEALHGDFGMLQSSDVLLAIAYGGETFEVVEVAKYARRFGIPVIAITGGLDSSLAKLANFVLDGSVTKEACSLNLAPTSSSTVAMALGDAIAVAAMRARGFSESDFADLHPGGKLGSKLSQVDYLMNKGSLPTVQKSAPGSEVIEVSSKFNFGIVAVLDDQNKLCGAISDGDIRRGLVKYGKDFLSTAAEALMTADPKTISPSTLAIDAVRIMNEKRHITHLLVVDPATPDQLVGIVRIADLFAAKIV